jgi:hypothetical protein
VQARNFSLGFDVPSLARLDAARKDSSVAAAWEAGFGPLYWMEGVAVRLQDRRGGAPARKLLLEIACAAASCDPRTCGAATRRRQPPPAPCSLLPARLGAGSGKVLSIMRVNNDLLCDLAALVEYDDVSVPGQLTGRFLRYASVPGLSVAHPALLYDAASDLYWLVSNVNRDPLRRWNTTNKAVRWNAFTMCESEPGRGGAAEGRPAAAHARCPLGAA